MKVDFAAGVPSWLAEWSDARLGDRLGEETVRRAAAYARDHMVLRLTTSADGLLLQASVRGSGSRSYETLLRARPGTHGGPVSWSGHCTCPMQLDCKHVGAVAIVARRLLAGPLPVAVSAWERQLTEVLRTEAPPPGAGTQLGLLLEVVAASASRYGAPTMGPRVRMRPVRRGSSDKWVKSGVGWRELEGGYASVALPAAQRALVRSLLATYRGQQAGYYGGYSDVTMHLDQLGPSAWSLLDQAVKAGVQLVGTHGAVHLASTPATALLDVRREEPGGDVTLAWTVRLPGEPDRSANEVRAVGSPAHGVFVERPDGLLLAALEQPMDEGTDRLLRQGGLRIPADEVSRFLGRYYPALRQRVTVESSDGSVALPEIEPPTLLLDVAFGDGHRTRLDWSFAYRVGEEVVTAPLDPAVPTDVARDAVAERELLSGLSVVADFAPLWVDAWGERRLRAQAELFGIDTAVFAETVLRVLFSHDPLTVRVTGAVAKYVESTAEPLIAVSTHDGGDGQQDWFDLSVDVSVGGEQVPLAPLLAALTLGQDHLILDSGTWFRLDRPELDTLRRLVEEARSLQDRESSGLRVTAFQAGLWEELVSLGVVEHQSARWAQTVGGLLSLEELPRPDPPAGLRATLRPYQLDGYHWLALLWDHRLGGILADDMGLGKTVQTLAMAARAREQGTLGGDAGPLLIVAPTSVVATWAAEAARFCPDLVVTAVTETERRSGRPLAEQAAGSDLVVTSYALLRIDEDAYRGLTWCGLVLDEAQFVKNHQAKTYQCARRLAAPFKLAITGTPLENSLMDLWSMLSITAPGLFPHPQRFTELYRKPIESGSGAAELASLRRRLRPLMLRRTKDQVATDLPPKVEQILEVTLNPAHRKVYDKHLQRERQRVLGLLDDPQRNRIAIFRSLTLLRQLSLSACLVDEQHAGKVRSSKIDVLMDQLSEVVAEGHRVLVFSSFTGFLSLVKARLDADGIDYCYLDGRTRNRPARIAEFTGGTAPVFLISLKAGGVGLTLTEADYVFVLDPWWNPAAEAQAVDRAHRIGQEKTVMVYRLVASGTIEEKVVALQQRKRDLFSRVVEDDGMPAGALTAEDIRALFD